MTSTRFIISPTLFSGLAGLVPGEKSPLSPLNIPDAPALTPDQYAGLVQANMMGDSGPTEPARVLLKALAQVTSFARLRLSAPGGFLDEAIHFPPAGMEPVTISMTPEGLALTASANVESILARLGEFTGAYAQLSTPWSVELPQLEMLALAALLDLRRKAVLRSLIDQQMVVPPPGDPVAVAAAIQAMWGNPQWLTAAVQNGAGLAAAPAAPQLQAALSALVEKKLAWQQSGMFLPIPEAIQVIDRFLLVGSILTLDAANSNSQGRCVFARQTWLQSGVSEMLYLTQVEDRLRLETVTPAVALEKIRFFLTIPDALPAPISEVAPLALVIQVGVGAGQVYPLENETVLGRGEQTTIRLLDTRASRRHTIVQKLPEGYQISDAGSTNGTYLNGKFLTGAAWLHENDVIAIGETHLKVIRAGTVMPVAATDRTVFTGSVPQPPVAAVPAAAESVPVPPAPEPVLPVVIPPAPVESLLPEPLPEPIPEPSFGSAPAMLCERCHEPLSLGQTVCGNCGMAVGQPPAPVPLPICPKCGNLVTPGMRFCGSCGQKLA